MTKSIIEKAQFIADIKEVAPAGVKAECSDVAQALLDVANALYIAANRLEGVSIAIDVHGQNINTNFFITEYKKYAEEARSLLIKLKENK